MRAVSSSNSDYSSSSYTTTTPEKPKEPDETRIEIEQAEFKEERAASKVPPLKIHETQQQFQAQLDRQPPIRVNRHQLKSFSKLWTKNLGLAVQGMKKDMQQGMSPDERWRADQLTKCAEGIVRDDGLDLETLALSEEIVCVAIRLQEAAADHPGNSPEAQQQRRIALIEFLCKVFNNEFESDAGRWAANLFNVGLRTWVVVTISTFVRDAVAFSVSGFIASDGKNVIPYAAGILAIILGPALNLLGGAISVHRHEANVPSIVSRTLLALMQLGAVLACYAMGSLNALATSMLSFAPYAIIRDCLNFIAPLSDNTTSLRLEGLLVSGVFYAGLQWGGGIAMAVLAPRSGAGSVTQFNIQDSLVHAAVNGILEFLDDVVVASIMRYLERKEYFARAKLNIADEAAHKQYILELTNFAKVLLGVNAEGRRSLIDEKNSQLYRREIERLKGLPGRLDAVHARYLEDIEEEFKKRPTLKAFWARDPRTLTAEEMQSLRELEFQLGVYKKSRDLERVRLISDKLDEKHARIFQALEKDVEVQRDRWLKLLEKQKSQKLNHIEIENLRYLQYEFDDTIQLKPARLPPMSSLWSDVRVPDFTSFDKKIMKTCRQLHAHLPREIRQALKKELYLYEFVRACLPLPLTPVEQAVMDSIGQKAGQVIPTELLGMFSQASEQQRSRDSAPLCFKVGVLSIATSAANNFFQQFGRKMLVTDAARLMVFGFILAGLILISSLLEGMDPFTQTVLVNMIVAMLVMMVYPMLYMMHNEGLSRSRPVQGPGARGTLPPLQEDAPEAIEDVNTPRGPNIWSAQHIRYDLSGSSVSELGVQAIYQALSGSSISSEDDQDSDDSVIRMSPLPGPDDWSE